MTRRYNGVQHAVYETERAMWAVFREERAPWEGLTVPEKERYGMQLIALTMVDRYGDNDRR